MEGKLTVMMREVLGGWVASNVGESSTTELVLEREGGCKTRERERD